MANWQRKLDLRDVWKTDDPQMVARAASERLRKLKPFGGEFDYLDDEREELADEFEGLSEDPSADSDDFDNVMSRLYDWGDTPMDDKWPSKKACWIATSF